MESWEGKILLGAWYYFLEWFYIHTYIKYSYIHTYIIFILYHTLCYILYLHYIIHYVTYYIILYYMYNDKKNVACYHHVTTHALGHMMYGWYTW